MIVEDEAPVCCHIHPNECSHLQPSSGKFLIITLYMLDWLESTNQARFKCV